MNYEQFVNYENLNIVLDANINYLKTLKLVFNNSSVSVGDKSAIVKENYEFLNLLEVNYGLYYTDYIDTNGCELRKDRGKLAHLLRREHLPIFDRVKMNLSLD